jgi:acetyl-CoA acyltransferase
MPTPVMIRAMLRLTYPSRSPSCAFGLKDDAAHVNPNGGALALGHPLGMSGARLALTATHTLADEGLDYGIATLCVGVGQGVAMLLGRP